ncbi:hypothetical protein EY06_15145, partial [Staphylococcus aureus]
ELTIAVLLSAQCTDVLVNRVTTELFKKYKTPEDYLAVSDEELMNDIRSIGLYRNKANEGSSNATLMTTLAVLRPTPAKLSNSLCV